jgi:glutathione S-transferase
MQLIIGNKNYSSWSLRPWLVLTHFGIPFQEDRQRLSFDPASPFKAYLARYAPTGKVPVLVDDGFVVWDTLAICEYLADRHPELPLWPADRLQRARARSLCAEMHAGFTALRNHCPMNIEAALPEVGRQLLAGDNGVAADLARIVSMWTGQLDASGGPFLFGAFTIADAYFAPVCSRIRTYALPVPEAVAAYIERVFALPAMQAWVGDALAEHDFLPFDEPYRTAP